MGEKKKSNANTTALIGAAFLMATSAIGPGFLTQTATFTGQYGSLCRRLYRTDSGKVDMSIHLYWK